MAKKVRPQTSAPPKGNPSGRPAVAAPRELVVVARNGTDTTIARETSLVGGTPSDSSSANRSFVDIVQSKGHVIRPLFGLSSERLKLRSAPKGILDKPGSQAPIGRHVADLSRYFRIHAPDEAMEEVAAAVRAHETVEAVFIKPRAEPATYLNSMRPASAEPPSQTPDFSTRQGYLEPSPSGVDANFAWTVPGGDGNGVSIIDVEGEWRFSHEALSENQGGVVGGTPPNNLGWRNHGTAVLGVFSGDRNDFGVTGVCPGADVRAISVFNDGAAAAIKAAADLLNPGDIILIELHYPGPRFNFESPQGQLGYIPAEWWPDNLAAVQYATQMGIIVVEAGGNGSENLDDPLYDKSPASPYGPFPSTWSNPFRRGVSDSGAIVVGAGAPPPGTHGQSWGPDRSRLDFSNYGAVIDVQGWGRGVTTTGYGDLQGGISEDLWYTDEFSGTSSASPLVVGTLGCVQGVLRAAGGTLLTPATARALLRNGGASQQSAPTAPISQRIGNRPDLRLYIEQLTAAAPATGKTRNAQEVQTININIAGTNVARIVNITLTK